MALTQGRLLDSLRFNRIIGRLAAQLDIERPLNFLARLPLVPAFDDEMMGRFTGKIIAADLVADDQQAMVNQSMTLDVITNSMVNVKVGEFITQKMLNRLNSWQEGLYRNVQGGEDALADWENQLAEKQLIGVRERQNAMAAAMYLDSFTYNRFGLNIQNATWNMPAGNKVTVGTAWSTAASATPLNDIWALDQTVRLAYGIEYDVITMSSQDFRNMVATTEFANKASIVLQAHFLVTSAALPTKNDPATQRIAAQILGKEIVIDDTTFWERNNAGAMTQTRVLPLGKVLLSRKQDERNGRAYDMANGIVTESMVADMVGGQMLGGNLAKSQYGPVGYYVGNPTLDPPNVTCWGVARCFPRKFIPETTAVLTVA